MNVDLCDRLPGVSGSVAVLLSVLLREGGVVSTEASVAILPGAGRKELSLGSLLDDASSAAAAAAAAAAPLPLSFFPAFASGWMLSSFKV
jgi:hypothetical protein